MSIISQKENSAELNLKMDNGDLEAMIAVKKKYGFKSYEGLLRYALKTMLQASDNKLSITGDDGNKYESIPSKQLLEVEDIA